MKDKDFNAKAQRRQAAMKRQFDHSDLCVFAPLRLCVKNDL